MGATRFIFLFAAFFLLAYLEYSFAILVAYLGLFVMICLLKKTELGEKRKKLEEEKGIIVRFVIGHRWV